MTMVVPAAPQQNCSLQQSIHEKLEDLQKIAYHGLARPALAV